MEDKFNNKFKFHYAVSVMKEMKQLYTYFSVVIILNYFGPSFLVLIILNYFGPSFLVSF